MNSVNELGASAQVPVRRHLDVLHAYRMDDGTPEVRIGGYGFATHAEIEEFIVIAREYMATYSNAAIAHSNNKLCGAENCAECERVKIRVKVKALLEDNFSMCRGAKNQSGFVYALRSGDLYKIGASVNPRSRLKQVEKKTGQPAELVHAIKTNSSFELEHYWHRRFAAYHEAGEWFRLPESAIAEFCSHEAMEATA